MDSTDKFLNINIYKDNKDRIDSSTNKSEEYIIAMNEELNNKMRELIEQINNVQSENDVLTDEIDKNEKSIVYQRGLMHNFNALKNYESDKYNFENKKNLLLNKYSNKIFEINKMLLNLIKYSHFGMIVIFILFYLFDLFTTDVLFVLILTIISNYYTIHSFVLSDIKMIESNNMLKENLTDLNSLINSKIKLIQEITSKSDFIGNLIDTS